MSNKIFYSVALPYDSKLSPFKIWIMTTGIDANNDRQESNDDPFCAGAIFP